MINYRLFKINWNKLKSKYFNIMEDKVTRFVTFEL